MLTAHLGKISWHHCGFEQSTLCSAVPWECSATLGLTGRRCGVESALLAQVVGRKLVHYVRHCRNWAVEECRVVAIRVLWIGVKHYKHWWCISVMSLLKPIEVLQRCSHATFWNCAFRFWGRIIILQSAAKLEISSWSGDWCFLHPVAQHKC